MKNEFKNFEEYFKLNEELQHQLRSDEEYAQELGLLDCKIIGATVINNGIKFGIMDNSSLLGYTEITIKNGKIDIHTEFVEENEA